MALNLTMTSDREEMKPRITVFGVGGAGGNAVNNMIDKALVGVELVVANTDAQALPGVPRLTLHVGLPHTATPAQIALAWLLRLDDEHHVLPEAPLGVSEAETKTGSASLRSPGSGAAPAACTCQSRLKAARSSSESVRKVVCTAPSRYASRTESSVRSPS